MTLVLLTIGGAFDGTWSTHRSTGRANRGNRKEPDRGAGGAGGARRAARRGAGGNAAKRKPGAPFGAPGRPGPYLFRKRGRLSRIAATVTATA